MYGGPARDQRSATKQLARVAWECKPDVFGAFVCTVLVVACELVMPLLTGQAVDSAITPGLSTAWTRHFPGHTALSVFVATLLGAAILKYAFHVGRRYTAGRLSITVQHILRVRLFERAHRLSGSQQDRYTSGEIISRSITDLNQIQGIMSMVPLALGSAVKVLASLVIMAMLSPRLTLLAVATLAVVILAVLSTRRPLFAATWTASQQAATVTTHIEETITGAEVVKSFGQEQRECDAMDRESQKLYGQRLRVARLTARYIPLIERIPQLSLVATIVVGGMATLDGAISIGVFVTFTLYLLSLTSVARMTTGMFMRIYLGMSSVERVVEIIDAAPDQAPTGRTEFPSGTAFGLRCKQLPLGGDPAGASLAIAPGTHCAIVGAPGSGKSMLLATLCRHYDAPEGSIELLVESNERSDGRTRAVSWNKLTDEWWHTHVGIVSENPFLFSATIRDNVDAGRGLSDEEIKRACAIAQIDEFIESLPDGYDTPIGAQGRALSGGQRQRIAVARALAHSPSIVLLDDATSAVDVLTEVKLYSALREHMPNATILAVTHRSSSVRGADTIVVLEHGRVTDAGPVPETTTNEPFARVMLPDGERLAQAVARPRRQASSHPHSAETAPTDRTPPHLRPLIDRLPAANARPAPFEATRTLGIIAEKRGDSRRISWRDLLQPIWPLIVASTLLLIGGVVADLAFPSLMRAALDNGVQRHDQRYILVVSVVGFVLLTLSWVAAIGHTLTTSRAGERLLYDLRVRCYRHVLAQDMQYYERTAAGSIITRLTTDIDVLSTFLQSGSSQVIVAFGTIVGITAMLCATSVPLTCVVLAAVPIIAVATHYFRIISRRLYHASRESISEVNIFFQESLAGLRTTQAVGAQEHRTTRMHGLSSAYTRLHIRAHLAVSLYFPGITAISDITHAAVIGYGAVLVTRGTVTPGVLVAFAMYLTAFFGPIQTLSQMFDGVLQANVSMRRLASLLDASPSLVDVGSTLDAATHAAGQLRLDDVAYAYRADDKPAVHIAEKTIEPGSTVAVVGATGAGKSTLVKLLARYYDPTTGRVLADGVDLRDFPLADWRHAYGIVPQDPMLFSGSIADNIAYGAPDASRDEIEAAARRVGADSVFSALTDGYDTLVAERGRNLSAGQRQLVALARAELLTPPIMLLDEATATLDPLTEQMVLNAEASLTRVRTAIVVAHRLSTAKRADRILVISHGEIVEDGSHEELVKRNDVYASMWHSTRAEHRENVCRK